MELDFQKMDGMLPAIVQDHESGNVLMLGFMNEEAFRRTVETGFVTFYSRSRKQLWMKGEQSGHRLSVKQIAIDCDRDALLLRVVVSGPGVCHNGYRSCFYRSLEAGNWVVTDTPSFDPAAVYGGK